METLCPETDAVYIGPLSPRPDTDFLVYLSHELRNALNAMLGHAQLLQTNEGLDDQATHSVERIVAAGWHLTGLLDEVHEVVTLEAGGAPVARDRIEIGPLLEELSLLVRPLARERSITLALGNLSPDAIAVADRRRLTQVVLNLLSNAIKYDHEGGRIDISAYVEDDRVHMRIADSGPGITPERLGALFEPFERLGAETGVIGGSGIGLALSQRLVELMEGSLEVESEPGAGAIFTVALPVALTLELDAADAIAA